MYRIVTSTLLTLALTLLTSCAALTDEEKITADKLPKAVVEVMKERFPGAEYRSLIKETENGKVFYDLEFTFKGRKCEMDIQEDGTIVNIEREIPAKDLPAAAAKALEQKYPKSTIKEVMEIKVPKGKEEALEGYEVVFVTADKKNGEIMVTAEGKILEEELDGKKLQGK